MRGARAATRLVQRPSHLKRLLEQAVAIEPNEGTKEWTVKGAEERAAHVMMCALRPLDG
jgi:hypothetical protein